MYDAPRPAREAGRAASALASLALAALPAASVDRILGANAAEFLRL